MTFYKENFWYHKDISNKINIGSVSRDIVNRIIKFERFIKSILVSLLWIALFTWVWILFLYFFSSRFSENFYLYVIFGVFLFLLIGFCILWVWCGKTYKLINKEAWMPTDHFGTTVSFFVFFMIPFINILIPYRFIRDTLRIFLWSNDLRVDKIVDSYLNSIVIFHVFSYPLFQILIDAWNGRINIGAASYMFIFILLFFMGVLSAIKDCIDVIIEEHKKLL